MLIEFLTKDITDALQDGGRQPLSDGAIIMKYSEADFGEGECNAFHRVDAVTEFGCFRAQEFSACRHHVEQIAHIHGCAVRACCGNRFGHAGFVAPGVIFFPCP